MLGETNPAASKPGTIRGDYCIQVLTIIDHVMSSFCPRLAVTSAMEVMQLRVLSMRLASGLGETMLWCTAHIAQDGGLLFWLPFRDEDICNWTPAQEDWVLGNN